MPKIDKEDILHAVKNATGVEPDATDHDENIAQIRAAAREGRVKFASTEQVDGLKTELQLVLEALGRAGAWVSDLSYVSDFGPSKDEVAQAAAKLGVPVARTDLLIDVAKRLKSKAVGPTA